MACVKPQHAHGRQELKKTPLLDTRNVLCNTPSKAASKLASASSRNADENQDPQAQGSDVKTAVPHKRLGVSRLPVPIKSQRAKTLTDASRSQRKQQETTKTKVQKSCTKSLAFNLPQSFSAVGPRKAPPGWEPKAPQSVRFPLGQITKPMSVLVQNAAYHTSTAAASSGLVDPCTSRVAGSTHALGDDLDPVSGGSSGQVSPSEGTLAQGKPSSSPCLFQPPPRSQTCPVPPGMLNPSTHLASLCHSTGIGSNPTVCTDTPPVIPPIEQIVLQSGSLKPPGSQPDPLEVEHMAVGSGQSLTLLQDSVTSSQMSTGTHGGPTKTVGHTVTFCPNPAALRSILTNEGVKPGFQLGATPPVSACPLRQGSIYLPQRIPVRDRQGAGAGAGNSVQFSPDPAALASILRNEGVQPGYTPRDSAPPSGRGSSVYLPQRVPITKSRSGPSVGVLAGPPCAESVSCRTPVVGWTPQRVPNTRPQSMRKVFLTHQTPVLRHTPKLKSVQGLSQPLESHQEENVVQRLFEDMEEELVCSRGGRTNFQKDDLSAQETAVKPSAEVETGPALGGDKTDKQSEFQPFLQASHRSSVIVFAHAGKVPDTASVVKGLRAQNGHAAVRLPATVSADLLQCPGSASVIKAGGSIQRYARLGAAISALRRRLQPLEEALLDEECAMYTSQQSGSPTQLQRCGNPVASTLHFQDSMGFVPVILPSHHLLPSAEDRTTVSSCDFTADQLEQEPPSVDV